MKKDVAYNDRFKAVREKLAISHAELGNVKKKDVVANFKSLSKENKLLLGIMILNSILLIAVAIKYPKFTNTITYDLWQVAQVVYIGYLLYKRCKE